MNSNQRKEFVTNFWQKCLISSEHSQQVLYELLLENPGIAPADKNVSSIITNSICMFHSLSQCKSLQMYGSSAAVMWSDEAFRDICSSLVLFRNAWAVTYGAMWAAVTRLRSSLSSFPEDQCLAGLCSTNAKPAEWPLRLTQIQPHGGIYSIFALY